MFVSYVTDRDSVIIVSAEAISRLIDYLVDRKLIKSSNYRKFIVVNINLLSLTEFCLLSVLSLKFPYRAHFQIHTRILCFY